MLNENPNADIDIFIVWLKMYEADTIKKVKEVSQLFRDDSRVSQFYDPARRCGQEVAEGLGGQTGEIAWDVYLFFDAKDEWGEVLPQPIDWVHQIESSSWAVPDRLYLGGQLTQKLRETMVSLLQNKKEA